MDKKSLEALYESGLKADLDHLEQWIKLFNKDIPACKGIVIGISGGIDSAVVAALCVRALGKDKVFGVIMPCESNPKDEQDARELCNHLNIKYATYSLTDVYHEYVKLFSYGDGLPVSGGERILTLLTRGNIKARLRMTLLYTVANRLSYLVAGTTNLSEYRVGYYTKYGDGGCDLEPIQNFLKTEVYLIARILGIPKTIIDRPPSAGLWEGQTDENEMGVSYAELDTMIADKCVSEKVYKMIVSSDHKRTMPPAFERYQPPISLNWSDDTWTVNKKFPITE